MICNICPRNCNINRDIHTNKNSTLGFCQMGTNPVIARYGKHLWEEPCISGENGSGTVFFSGCSLKCIYCQNNKISINNVGKEITVDRLKKIYKELISMGVHNINLVTPTHFTDSIVESLDEKLSVPVVYNCSGYEKIETLKKLNDKVDIYLVDMKYSKDEIGMKYSNVKDYVETSKKAIHEMYNQTGNYVIDSNGIMQKGIIIRHLILPGNIENSFGVIDWVKNTFDKGQVLFSLMSQYTPIKNDFKYEELNRKITKKEFEAVEKYLFNSGIEDGFMQDLSSSSKQYIPDFNINLI